MSMPWSICAAFGAVGVIITTVAVSIIPDYGGSVTAPVSEDTQRPKDNLSQLDVEQYDTPQARTTGTMAAAPAGQPTKNAVAGRSTQTAAASRAGPAAASVSAVNAPIEGAPLQVQVPAPIHLDPQADAVWKLVATALQDENTTAKPISHGGAGRWSGGASASGNAERPPAAGGQAATSRAAKMDEALLRLMMGTLARGEASSARGHYS